MRSRGTRQRTQHESWLFLGYVFSPSPLRHVVPSGEHLKRRPKTISSRLSAGDGVIPGSFQRNLISSALPGPILCNPCEMKSTPVRQHDADSSKPHSRRIVVYINSNRRTACLLIPSGKKGSHESHITSPSTIIWVLLQASQQGRVPSSSPRQKRASPEHIESSFAANHAETNVCPPPRLPAQLVAQEDPEDHDVLYMWLYDERSWLWISRPPGQCLTSFSP